MLQFVLQLMSKFVTSSYFAYFGYIVMAFGFIICIIRLIRKVITENV